MKKIIFSAENLKESHFVFIYIFYWVEKCFHRSSCTQLCHGMMIFQKTYKTVVSSMTEVGRGVTGTALSLGGKQGVTKIAATVAVAGHATAIGTAAASTAQGLALPWHTFACSTQ